MLYFCLLSPMFLVYFEVLGITFEVGHLGWGCFWESIMRTIFHTIGNFWMFKSHLNHIEMLGDAQTRHYTHHLFLMYPLNPLPSPPSIICSPIHSPSIRFLSSHVHGALCAWPSSSFYHPSTEPITISNHLQLILHVYIHPKIKHLSMVSVLEIGTSNADNASININTMVVGTTIDDLKDSVAMASLFSSPSSSTPNRYENQLRRSPVTAIAFSRCYRIAATAPVSTALMHGWGSMRCAMLARTHV